MQPEYIEFEIKAINKFEDFIHVYELISAAKKSGDIKTDQFWLTTFPSYSIKKCFFNKSDLKPNDVAIDNKNEYNWHFYSLIQHLIENLDVELGLCIKHSDIKGRLEFVANGYPYGGIGGLTFFLNCFDCKAIKIDDGVGLYNVVWKSDFHFELINTMIFTNVLSFWKKIKSKF